ncbi:hypothetical protein U713_05345 [Rhodobacter capsulatus YW2]|nr:hypothetical protein U713_05345 [Rhodobacter capsulatus YW2]
MRLLQISALSASPTCKCCPSAGFAIGHIARTKIQPIDVRLSSLRIISAVLVLLALRPARHLLPFPGSFPATGNPVSGRAVPFRSMRISGPPLFAIPLAFRAGPQRGGALAALVMPPKVARGRGRLGAEAG